ncbi:MAG TPA: hypothetical protein PKE64_11955 [Anaerolineae bacterium]|nr:hypothetical protein [Anaerolineae bacterium]HMR64712.1 hypothetical protein [Anaerolineae bacterium]
MSTPIKLLGFDSLLPTAPAVNGEQRLSAPENWYAEPFTKRTTCRTPGQCGGNCDCGCPYNTMTEVERLPLIEEIAKIFPNEWLAFIISPEEDRDFEPIHGKLVAHSPNPDDVYDAVNTVLWNQHVYVFFNGDFTAMKASYGQAWEQAVNPVDERTFSGPKQVSDVARSLSGAAVLPENVLDLVYSVIDTLYGEPNLNESIRRLRLARVRAAQLNNEMLLPVIDSALDQLETGLPRVNEVKWFLEEALADLEETVLTGLS